jgi:WD40 repeat protein
LFSEYHVLTGHVDGVTCVELFAMQEGTDKMQVLAISGSADTTLRVWNVMTGHCLRVLSGHKDRVKSLSLLKSTATILPTLITTSEDNTVLVWKDALIPFEVSNYIVDFHPQSLMLIDHIYSICPNHHRSKNSFLQI